MAVPLLPHNLMAEVYEEILRETFVFNLQGRYTLLTKFKRYVRSTWMKNYENLSVFGLDRRTNNACESYHSRFNALVGRNHPGAYKFADFANEMLENYHMDFMRLKEHPNEPIVCEIRPAQEDRMARLRQLERRLTNGRITPMEFIDKNTHSADGVIQQAIDARRRRRNGEADLEETSDEESDDYIHEDESQDESENEDPTNDGNLVPPNNDNLVSCKSCGQDCVDKYLLVPCGHHPFCNNCQLNEFCTECDANVQIRAKMN